MIYKIKGLKKRYFLKNLKKYFFFHFLLFYFFSYYFFSSKIGSKSLCLTLKCGFLNFIICINEVREYKKNIYFSNFINFFV